MRGCVHDLNMLGIFYHAGFETIATLAFALHVLNPHNAHALSQANFRADFPQAHVEKIRQVASRLAKSTTSLTVEHGRAAAWSKSPFGSA